MPGDSLGTAASSVQAPKPSRSKLLDVGAPLADEVRARDAAVDDPVLHVLGDVRGADEQHVDRRVAAGEGERALAGLLRPEPRVLEQGDGRLAQPPLDRDGDRQAVARVPASPPVEHQPIAALAVAQPVRHPRHGRRRRARSPAHLVIRQPTVDQLRRLPAVRHRLQLRERAQIAQEPLRLVDASERDDRLQEISCLFRLPFGM